jgi:putative endonuclease
MPDVARPAGVGPGLAAGTALPQRHNSGMPAASPWFVYLLECRNGSYYCGITNDLDARFKAHVAGRGARYTRAHPPLRVLGSRVFPDRAAASRAEWQLKQLPRARKLPWLLTVEPAD